MIDVLISTYGDGIKRAINVPLPKRKDVRYIISHQSLDSIDNHVDDFIQSRDDVFYFKINSKGLSKNRNNAINKSSSDYIYFCDDDVTLNDSVFDTIIKSFEKYDADAISFKIETHGLKPFKRYKNKAFKHNILSSLRVSSIELVCKRSSIVKNNLFFDEDFGLGAKYIASEENIFVSDMIKSGLTIFFLPIYIVYHSEESSGKNWSSSALVYSKGAFFRRVFGDYISLVLIFIFALKKYNEYKNDISFLNFLRQSMLGYKEYL